MKKTILLLSALLMSSSVFAAISTTHSDRSFKSNEYQTKQEAYDAGYEMMDTLRTMPASELRNKLGIIENTLQYNSIKIDDMKLSVEEYSKQLGDMKYRAILNVDYQYKYRDND
ncbi:DUF3316 domain-containing protein [Vibrio sp. TRT 21S02]|uniref:DUF3316 domain-containing protein n=1 Tax=unclassified Vibrio TaxID=2614977 RepID=UPI00349F2DD7